MLKKMFCQMDLDLILKPEDPILIKSGFATLTSSDMPFVKTYRSGSKPEVYLPGSSLKGVIRSQAEKICRTLKDHSVCLPYEKETPNETSCGERFKKLLKENGKEEIPSYDIYRLSCPACRLFGSTSFIGRCHISDAYVEEGWKKEYGIPEPELRDGVAIDRHTGGAVSGAKFDWEVVTRGEFKSHITVRNFEVWQIGLLAYIFKDFNESLIRIGLGKSRGLGRMSGIVKNLKFIYYKDPNAEFKGIADLCSIDESEHYGFFRRKEEDVPPLIGTSSSQFPYNFNMEDTQMEIFSYTATQFNLYIDNVNWPGDFVSYAKTGGN